MVNQQKLHTPLRAFYHFSVGAYNHAVSHGHRTGCDWFWCLFHLDKAHPAVAGDKPFMIAKARYLYSCFLTGLQYSNAIFDVYFPTVDGELSHLKIRFPVRPPSLSAASLYDYSISVAKGE